MNQSNYPIDKVYDVDIQWYTNADKSGSIAQLAGVVEYTNCISAVG